MIADLQGGGFFRQNDDLLFLVQFQRHPTGVAPCDLGQLVLGQRDLILRPRARKLKILYVVPQRVARRRIDRVVNGEGLGFPRQILNVRTRKTDTFNVSLGSVRIGLDGEVELEIKFGADEIRLQKVVV